MTCVSRPDDVAGPDMQVLSHDVINSHSVVIIVIIIIIVVVSDLDIAKCCA